MCFHSSPLSKYFLVDSRLSTATALTRAGVQPPSPSTPSMRDFTVAISNLYYCTVSRRDPSPR